MLDFDRRLCCKLHIIRLRTHRRIKEIASWVPPRVASSLRGTTRCPSRAHQGQHRKQWSGDAVAAVAALIHAVDTLLRRAWEASYAKGLQSISRRRARGRAA